MHACSVWACGLVGRACVCGSCLLRVVPHAGIGLCCCCLSCYCWSPNVIGKAKWLHVVCCLCGCCFASPRARVKCACAATTTTSNGADTSRCQEIDLQAAQTKKLLRQSARHRRATSLCTLVRYHSCSSLVHMTAATFVMTFRDIDGLETCPSPSDLLARASVRTILRFPAFLFLARVCAESDSRQLAKRQAGSRRSARPDCFLVEDSDPTRVTAGHMRARWSVMLALGGAHTLLLRELGLTTGAFVDDLKVTGVFARLRVSSSETRRKASGASEGGTTDKRTSKSLSRGERGGRSWRTSGGDSANGLSPARLACPYLQRRSIDRENGSNERRAREL